MLANGLSSARFRPVAAADLSAGRQQAERYVLSGGGIAPSKTPRSLFSADI